VLAGWRNHFSQLLNVHGVNGGRQTEIHTAQPLVSEPSVCEIEMAVERLKESNRLVLIQSQQGDRAIHLESHKYMNSIWNKEEFPEKWRESIVVPHYKKGDRTDCSNYRGKSLCQLRTKFYTKSCCKGKIHMHRKFSGIISVDFGTIGQLLIYILHSSHTWGKKWEYN